MAGSVPALRQLPLSSHQVLNQPVTRDRSSLSPRAFATGALYASQEISLGLIQTMFNGFFSPATPSGADITVFLEQLLSFIQSGIPLSQALELMQKGRGKSRPRALAAHVQFDLQKGQPLSESFQQRLGRGNEILSRMVELGEKSGHLESILEHLVAQRKRHARMRKHVLQAMSYPTLLIVVSLLVIWVLATVIVPEFEKIYDSFGAELPAHTRLTLEIAHFVVQEGVWVLLALAMLTFGLWLLCKKHWLLRWHLTSLVWRLPGVGTFQRATVYYEFATCMHLICKSGMPLGKSLAWLPTTAHHLHYRAALECLGEDVLRGVRLHKAISDTAFFSPFVEKMVAIGESSGKLDKVFGHIEKHYEQKIQDYARLATQILEPVMVIVVSVLVGWTVVSMYMPIFSLGFAL